MLKFILNQEIAEARDFVLALPEGSHRINSKNYVNAYADEDSSRNWYYAVGGFAVWSRGLVTLKRVDTLLTYELDFEFVFEDRYNWDKGKSVKLLGKVITDIEMGRFHREGLAREFRMTGSIFRKITGTEPTIGAPKVNQRPRSR